MKTVPPKKDAQKTEDLPIRPLLDELALVRKLFHTLAARYTAQIEGELAAIRDVIATTAARKTIPRKRAREMSDILHLLRGVAIKPEKGRRRDFKRIEALVEEMRRIVDDWD